MSRASTAERAAEPFAADEALVRRALASDGDAVRTIIRTHNQRLYRLARSVVRNDFDAEEVLQEAYVAAFSHLGSFRGEASLATWLSRIVINEALGRLRKKKREPAAAVSSGDRGQAEVIRFPAGSADPERTMAQRQILQLVENAMDELPDLYRTVFVARVIEGLTIEETATLLDLRPETVKTRLHRARTLVRKRLDAQIGPVLMDAFPFAGRRCERLTATVLRRLGLAD